LIPGTVSTGIIFAFTSCVYLICTMFPPSQGHPPLSNCILNLWVACWGRLK
jgi:hypothetical protein